MLDWSSSNTVYAMSTVRCRALLIGCAPLLRRFFGELRAIKIGLRMRLRRHFCVNYVLAHARHGGRIITVHSAPVASAKRHDLALVALKFVGPRND